MTNEEKRLFYQELDKKEGLEPTKKDAGAGGFRYMVATIFGLVFIADSVFSFIVFRTVYESWWILLFLFRIFLNLCFLAVIFWVAEDKETSEELKRQIKMLKEKIEKS